MKLLSIILAVIFIFTLIASDGFNHVWRYGETTKADHADWTMPTTAAGYRSFAEATSDSFYSYPFNVGSSWEGELWFYMRYDTSAVSADDSVAFRLTRWIGFQWVECGYIQWDRIVPETNTTLDSNVTWIKAKNDGMLWFYKTDPTTTTSQEGLYYDRFKMEIVWKGSLNGRLFQTWYSNPTAVDF